MSLIALTTSNPAFVGDTITLRTRMVQDNIGNPILTPDKVIIVLVRPDGSTATTGDLNSGVVNDLGGFFHFVYTIPSDEQVGIWQSKWTVTNGPYTGEFAGAFEVAEFKAALSPFTGSVPTTVISAFPSLTSDPSNPLPGQVWFNSTTGKVKYFDGTNNVTIFPITSNVRPGQVTWSPGGPDQFGDYGPNTFGSTTEGYQEAINDASANHKPLYGFGDFTLTNVLNLTTPNFEWTHDGTITLASDFLNIGDASHDARQSHVKVHRILANGHNVWNLYHGEQCVFEVVAGNSTGGGEYAHLEPRGPNGMSDTAFKYQVIQGFLTSFHLTDPASTGWAMQGIRLIGGIVFGTGASVPQTGVLIDGGVNGGLGEVYGGIDIVLGSPAGSRNFVNNGVNPLGGWKLDLNFMQMNPANNVFQDGDVIINPLGFNNIGTIGIGPKGHIAQEGSGLAVKDILVLRSNTTGSYPVLAHRPADYTSGRAVFNSQADVIEGFPRAVWNVNADGSSSIVTGPGTGAATESLRISQTYVRIPSLNTPLQFPDSALTEDSTGVIVLRSYLSPTPTNGKVVLQAKAGTTGFQVGDGTTPTKVTTANNTLDDGTGKLTTGASVTAGTVVNATNGVNITTLNKPLSYPDSAISEDSAGLLVLRAYDFRTPGSVGRITSQAQNGINAFVVGDGASNAKLVTTANNTLDDGSSNATFFGNLSISATGTGHHVLFPHASLAEDSNAKLTLRAYDSGAATDGQVRIQAQNGTNSLVIGDGATAPGKVSTVNNVLDGGSGNMTLAGQLNLPLNKPVAFPDSTLNEDSTGTLVARSYSTGAATDGKIVLQAQNGTMGLQVGDGATVPKKVSTANYTVDDGSGNIVNKATVQVQNSGGTERLRLESGSAGNRGAIKMWDVTAAAYKWVYVDNGAWVISATEPT